MSDETDFSDLAERFFQIIPADDYALLVKRDGAQYMERVVAFGITDIGLNPPNPFRSQSGRVVPIVARHEIVNGELTSVLREGRGTLLHATAFAADQSKIAALKTGKPVGRL